MSPPLVRTGVAKELMGPRELSRAFSFLRELASKTGTRHEKNCSLIWGRGAGLLPTQINYLGVVLIFRPACPFSSIWQRWLLPAWATVCICFLGTMVPTSCLLLLCRLCKLIFICQTSKSIFSQEPLFLDCHCEDPHICICFHLKTQSPNFYF